MPRTPRSGAMRMARGLVCAIAGLLLGSAAHVVAQGQPPGPLATTVAFAVLALVCVAVAETERGFVFIAAVLGGGQFFLHLAFSIGSPSLAVFSGHGAAHHLTGHGTGHGSGHGVVGGAVGGAVGRDPFAGSAADAATGTGGETLTAWPLAMALGHVLATLVTAALLAHGERVLWRLARLVVPLLGWGRLVPVPLAVPRDTCPEPVTLPPPNGVLFARCTPRRGPPRHAII